jgi:Family of unknown function (DUF6636)
MWRLVAVLAAALLLMAGCGSDSDKKPSTAAAPPTTSTGTLPSVQGKHGKKGQEAKRIAPAGDRIDTGASYFFMTPSKKIGCGFFRDPTTLRCDTNYETSFSRSGHKCTEGDYGHAFQVDASGAGKAICAGDTVMSATEQHTIPYGKTWRLGPFSCSAETSGLTCRSGGGHGFSLSVQSQ